VASRSPSHAGGSVASDQRTDTAITRLSTNEAAVDRGASDVLSARDRALRGPAAQTALAHEPEEAGRRRPRLTIVVETINSVEYEREDLGVPNTIEDLVAALDAQSCPEPVEVLLMVGLGAGESEGTIPTKDAIAAHGPRIRTRHRIRVVGVENATYFIMKNRGAELATTEFVAFLDDDCIPGPNWVSGSLGALDAGADAVIGRTRYRGPGFWARVMDCLDWGDVRGRTDGSAACLLPNNSAYRRDAYLRYPWDLRHRRSGGCIVPYLQMVADGRHVAYEPTMAAAHGNNYRERGGIAHRLRNGHDTAVVLREDNDGIVPHRWLLRLGPAGGVVVALGRIWGDLRRLTEHRADFGISAAAVPVVWLIMAPMRLIEGAAYALSSVRPDIIGRRWG
jgi:Glycosyl transferase family 2